MPHRLAELRQQRALIREHLAWLDREISALERPDGIAEHRAERSLRVEPDRPAEPLIPPSGPSPAVAPRPDSGVEPSIAPPPDSAESILNEYRVTPTAVKADVRKGCLLYFFAAFVLLALTVLALYFAIGSR